MLKKKQDLSILILRDPKLEQSKTIKLIPIDKNNLELYSEISLKSWGIKGRSQKALLRESLEFQLENQTDMHSFIVFNKETPTAITSLTIRDNTAYLKGSAVDSPYRGLGIYKEILKERISFARSKGCRYFLSIADRSSSAPILELQGFQEAATLECWTRHERPWFS